MNVLSLSLFDDNVFETCKLVSPLFPAAPTKILPSPCNSSAIISKSEEPSRGPKTPPILIFITTGFPSSVA